MSGRINRRHTSVRLFTFDNHPPQHLWNYYQIWVGGLVRGKGIYAIKPETEEEDRQNRKKDDVAPSVEVLMKVFRIFDSHGLIKNDLCFDPEHFMETVVLEHWNKYE